jgi:hypothetical protein
VPHLQVLKFKVNRAHEERKRAEKELRDTQELSQELAGLASVGVKGVLEDPPVVAQETISAASGDDSSGNVDHEAFHREDVVVESDNDDAVPQTSPLLHTGSNDSEDGDGAALIEEDDDDGAVVSESEHEHDPIDDLHDSIKGLGNLAVGIQVNLKKPVDRFFFAAGELPTEEVDLIYAKEGSGRPPAAREVRTDVISLEVLSDAKFEGLPHQTRGGGRLPTSAQLDVNPWIKTCIDLIRDAWETGALASYIDRVHARDLDKFLAEYKKEASTTVERLLAFLRKVAEEDIIVTTEKSGGSAGTGPADGRGGGTKKSRAGGSQRSGHNSDDDSEEEEEIGVVDKLRELPNGGAYITALKLPNGKIQAAASFQGEDGPSLTMRAWRGKRPVLLPGSSSAVPGPRTC